jgi:hypothetical protein
MGIDKDQRAVTFSTSTASSRYLLHSSHKVLWIPSVLHHRSVSYYAAINNGATVNSVPGHKGSLHIGMGEEEGGWAVIVVCVR